MKILVTGGAGFVGSHLKKYVRPARTQAADVRVERATAELADRGVAH